MLPRHGHSSLQSGPEKFESSVQQSMTARAAPHVSSGFPTQNLQYRGVFVITSEVVESHA